MIWPAESIWEAVYPLLPDFTVEVLPQVDSTNSELMRRVHAGHCEPTLLVAEQQTAGRGRLGRDWHSAAGDSLTFSLVVPLAPADWSGLSLAVGVALAVYQLSRARERAGRDAGVERQDAPQHFGLNEFFSNTRSQPCGNP